MKRILQGMIMAVAVLSFVSLSIAAEVKGTVEKIDEKGSFYFIKDAKGKEHKVHFDASTKMTGDVKVGAAVEVNETKGHAKSIKVEEKNEVKKDEKMDKK
ncbi:MAG: hypothetical protein IT392_11065 [Nitrospirae bacterium]|nr:hypothetical protein [Nitrospirota bacterium]